MILDFRIFLNNQLKMKLLKLNSKYYEKYIEYFIKEILKPTHLSHLSSNSLELEWYRSRDGIKISLYGNCHDSNFLFP